MYIKCWGARGGIPVSGPEYLVYGGDTPCLEIRDDAGTTIIVDSGTGIRRLGTKLVREERFDLNIIFSHSHWDHIIGFPFFKPVYDPRFKINILGSPRCRGIWISSLKTPSRLHIFLFSQIRSRPKWNIVKSGGSLL